MNGVVYTEHALAFLDERGSLIGYEPPREAPVEVALEPVEPPKEPEYGPDEGPRRRCKRCRKIFGGVRAERNREYCSAHCTNVAKTRCVACGKHRFGEFCSAKCGIGENK